MFWWLLLYFTTHLFKSLNVCLSCDPCSRAELFCGTVSCIVQQTWPACGCTGTSLHRLYLERETEELLPRLSHWEALVAVIMTAPTGWQSCHRCCGHGCRTHYTDCIVCVQRWSGCSPAHLWFIGHPSPRDGSPGSVDVQSSSAHS